MIWMNKQLRAYVGYCDMKFYFLEIWGQFQPCSKYKMRNRSYSHNDSPYFCKMSDLKFEATIHITVDIV